MYFTDANGKELWQLQRLSSLRTLAGRDISPSGAIIIPLIRCHQYSKRNSTYRLTFQIKLVKLFLFKQVIWKEKAESSRWC